MSVVDLGGTAGPAVSRSGSPIYCPHGRLGGILVEERDGSNCSWSYDRNDKKGQEFLATHLRIVHKGADPRPAVGTEFGVKARPRLAAEVQYVRQEIERPDVPAASQSPGPKLCKTDGCENLANTRYDRGFYAGLCVEVCIPARRAVLSVEASERAKQQHAKRDKIKPDPRAAIAVVEPSPPVQVSAELDIDVGRIIKDGSYAEEAGRLRAVEDILRRKADALAKIAEGLDDLAATEL